MGLERSYAFTHKGNEKDYKDYLAPDFVIHVGSAMLDSRKVPVTGLEVKMTLEGAGYARFTLAALYDYKLSKWVSDLISGIEIGQLVDVEVGYSGKDSRIFLGYVDSYTVNFDSGSTPGITVTAMDAIAILNSDRREISAGEKVDKDFVEGLIKDSKLGSLVEKVSVSDLNIQQLLDVKKNVSRGEFILEQAKRNFYSFCVIDGELILDNLGNNTKKLTTLTMGVDPKSFSKTVNLKSRMVGTVTVKALDKELNPIAGSASSISGGGGKGPYENKFTKDSVLSINAPELDTAEACQKLSENILKGVSWGFLEADAECIGYPEMTPGRYIGVAGLDKRSNGDYFVTSVVHSFSSDGYVNKIHMKGLFEK